MTRRSAIKRGLIISYAAFVFLVVGLLVDIIVEYTAYMSR